MSKLTGEQKVQRAVVLKNEGNEFFQADKLQEAMRKYHESLMYATGLDTSKLPFAHSSNTENLPDHVLKEAVKVRLVCYTNLAACHAKKENWPRVKEYATKALELDADHIKARFRRGQACLRLNELDSAESDLSQVAQADPTDSKVKAELKTLRERQAAADKKQQKELSGFLTRVKDVNLY